MTTGDTVTETFMLGRAAGAHAAMAPSTKVSGVGTRALCAIPRLSLGTAGQGSRYCRATPPAGAERQHVGLRGHRSSHLLAVQ